MLTLRYMSLEVISSPESPWDIQCSRYSLYMRFTLNSLGRYSFCDHFLHQWLGTGVKLLMWARTQSITSSATLFQPPLVAAATIFNVMFKVLWKKVAHTWNKTNKTYQFVCRSQLQFNLRRWIVGDYHKWSIVTKKRVLLSYSPAFSLWSGV